MSNRTEDSIQRTIVYGPSSFLAKENPHFTLIVSCLFKKVTEGKTAILNYASYKHPGGYFLGGSPAQEEALCHESNLYPILLSFDNTYYAWNKKNLNRALYLDRALYSPDVVFEKGGKQKKADVITCAAPNYRTAHRFQQVSLEFLRIELFYCRIE